MSDSAIFLALLLSIILASITTPKHKMEYATPTPPDAKSVVVMPCTDEACNASLSSMRF